MYYIIVVQRRLLQKSTSKSFSLLVLFYYKSLDNLLFKCYYIHIHVIVLKFGENIMKSFSKAMERFANMK